MSAAGLPDDVDEINDYELLQKKLDTLISEGLRKVDGSGRIRDVKKEQARVKWCNMVVRAVSEYRKLENDSTLEDLTERVEAIEEQRGG